MWNRIKTIYFIFTIKSFIVICLFAATPALSAFFCPATGHYYDFVPTFCFQRWDLARDQAAGAGGYLVTVTSAAEQTCLENNAVAGSWWAGGSDAASEGVWLWVTGPEAGTQFWQGFFASAGGFATAPFFYANWFTFEPNSSAEDYMVWNTGGGFGWNDVGITNPIVCGFIIEYDTNPDGEPGVNKEISNGPDVDEDRNFDLVVEVGQSSTTEYSFDITYSNPGGPPVLIFDTLPAEWIVNEVEGSITGLPLDCGGSASFSNDFGMVDLSTGGKAGKKCQSNTKIQWMPPDDGSTINIIAETRQSPGKNNVKFAPTSCGPLFLNDGAVVLEKDPATGEPLRDAVTGELLPPLFESNQLCLAAVEDVNGDGIIARDGSGDEDGDGLTDLEEACEFDTDPCNPDTDSDGINDGEDQCPLEGPPDAGAGETLGADGCIITA